MADENLILEDARRSYELRLRRVRQVYEQLEVAKAELRQLFEHTFVDPDMAAAQFLKFVDKHGLVRATMKMHSEPTKFVPRWKELVGRIHPFDGMNRKREQAMENVKRLPEAYRKAEDAREAHRLADTLFQEAGEQLIQLQKRSPELDVENQKPRQKRKLGQRPKY